MSDSSLGACRVDTGRPAHGPLIKHAIGKLAAAGGGDRAGREAPDAIPAAPDAPRGYFAAHCRLAPPRFRPCRIRCSAWPPGSGRRGRRTDRQDAEGAAWLWRASPRGFSARACPPRFGAPVHGDYGLAEHRGCRPVPERAAAEIEDIVVDSDRRDARIGPRARERARRGRVRPPTHRALSGKADNVRRKRVSPRQNAGRAAGSPGGQKCR